MALSLQISNTRPRHRSARISGEAFQGCVALDFPNGQAITLGAASVQSTVFDANNDRIVMCAVGGASTVVGGWITVGTSPTATAGAGSLWISQTAAPVAVYVPAGMRIAGLQGATAGTLAMIPALIASDP